MEWRFGDDTLSTAMEPVHTYKATGNYDVELRTFSSTGAVSKNVAVLTKLLPGSSSTFYRALMKSVNSTAPS